MFFDHGYTCRSIFKNLLVLSIYSVVWGDVLFKPDTVPCLGTPQEYQCVVNGTGMQWQLLDSDDMVIDGSTVIYGSTNNGSNAVFNQFTFEQLDNSPTITTNVSFTTVLDVNSSSIECVLFGSSIKETFRINIPGIPPSPSNVTIHADTFTNTSVNISWTESSSPCVTRYRYNVSSVTEGNIVMESATSNGVLVEGLVPSDEQYCVVVTAIDTANRNSSESDPPSYFIFNVPPSVGNITVTHERQSNTTLEVTVEWIEAEFDVLNTTVVPELEYRVSIFNATDPNDYNKTDSVPSDITEHTFYGVPTGRTYTITVTAINGVGISNAATNLFEAPGPYVDLNPKSPVPPISPLPTVTITMEITTTTDTQLSSASSNPVSSSSSSSFYSSSSSSSSSSSISPSSGVSENSAPVAAIAGGIGGGVGLILGIVVIVFIVLLCYKMKMSKSVNLVGDSEKFSGGSGTSKPIHLEDTSDMPQIGQPLYQDVTSGGAKTTELATYQDPSTIRREQAPGSNDLYALPEKKKSEVELPPQGQMYAELDLPNKTSSDNKTTVVVPGTTTEPVIYSDVRGQ